MPRCVEQTANCAGQCRGIRSIGMSPINHPSRALIQIDLVQLILKNVNAVGVIAGLCQGMIYGREQIVQW